MLKAVVNITTGAVMNVIEIEPDGAGTFDHWPVPDNHVLLEATAGAEAGASWDGSKFTPAPREEVPPTRQEELLAIGKDNWTAAQQKELIELLAQAQA